MKKTHSLLFLIMFSCIVNGQNKSLRTFVSYSLFYDAVGHPYYEFYFAINSASLHYVRNSDSLWEASIEAVILFEQHDSIKFSDKLTIKLPPTVDTTIAQTFFYIDKINVSPGTYTLEIAMKDANVKSIPAYFNEEVIVPPFHANNIQLSGIELVYSMEPSDNPEDLFYKMAHRIIPYPSTVFPDNMKNFSFYFEIYNAHLSPDSELFLRYYFEEIPIHKVYKSLDFSTPIKHAPFQPILQSINISTLPTGFYLFHVEVLNKRKELLAKNSMYIERVNNSTHPNEEISAQDLESKYKTSFVQRYNDVDSLKYFVSSLYPIASLNERVFISKLKKVSVEEMKQFFYGFWIRRAPDNPEQAWLEYKKQVDYVEKMYKTQIKHGFETDRGRVYLQYGPPNSISKEDHEPSAYPYEIWHYYKVNNQSNRKFIFYNPDLVTNDYQLIYSDVFGELSDYNWRVKLLRRNYASSSIDEQDPDFGWGSKVNDFFKDPH